MRSVALFEFLCMFNLFSFCVILKDFRPKVVYSNKASLSYN